jgi:hypothetical protein
MIHVDTLITAVISQFRADCRLLASPLPFCPRSVRLVWGGSGGVRIKKIVLEKFCYWRMKPEMGFGPSTALMGSTDADVSTLSVVPDICSESAKPHTEGAFIANAIPTSGIPRPGKLIV